MKERRPEERKKDFREVPCGLSLEEALKESERCLQCENAPCMKGCPAEIRIPDFIRALKEGRFDDALAIIKKTSSLPAVCGRVCPQEDQCKLACVLGPTGDPIDIAALERFAADHGKDRPPDDTGAGKKGRAAVIGSGPAGLTCAADLARKGYIVTVFEALHRAGGVLVYGIPGFRLPDSIVNDEVAYIENIGVEFKLDHVAGRTVTLDGLKKMGYGAVFIATGAGLPYFPGIDGENLNGVYSANEFLGRVNLMKAYRFPEYDTPVDVGCRVAVIGGGNVAMDSARSAIRLGAAEVTVVYRRTEKEMPARRDEVAHAGEEGVSFRLLEAPVGFSGDEKGHVREMTLIKNTLGEPDKSGRRRPVPVEGSEEKMRVDTVIMAIGSGANPLFLRTADDLELTGRGYIRTGDDCSTNLSGVFAGGDIVTGSATVIAAIGAGKRAARSMDRYMRDRER